MLSTPSYFKLKPQLRLAAEYDPSTYIEFELRCNLRCLNLRYRTVLPQFALGNRYANLHQEPRLMSLLPPHLPDGLPTTLGSTITSAPVVLCTRSSTNQRSDMAMTSVIASRSSPLRSPLARSSSWLQTSSPREAQPPRATAAPACPRTARPAFR